MRETSEEIREHRQNLIRAESAHPNPEFGPLLDKSNADDLQWLLERLNAQIGESHRRVDDSEEASARRARRRANRNAVGTAFANRREAEKLADRQEIRRSAKFKKAIQIIAVVIGFFGLMVGIFALLVNIFK